MSITVFGSLNLDLTVTVDHMPQPGATNHASGLHRGLGGKGANQAVAATKLASCPVRFVAAMGQDAFGESLVEDLKALNVNVDDMVVFPDSDTGMAFIHVDTNSQNTITVVGGANMAWPSQGPDDQAYEGCKVALFQLETPLEATLSAMRKARAAGATVILDPAPVAKHGMSDLMAEADIITPNETEAAAIVGKMPCDFGDAIEVAKDLCRQGPKIAIVKLGAKGLAFATADGETGSIEPFKVKSIDTVAAGDSFNGGLAAALAEGLSLTEALRFASAAGALATTKTGASEAVPTREQVLDLLAMS